MGELESTALERAALDYLRAHHVLTLAVADREGPWAAAVFYASAGSRLIFLSDPHTRHARAIEANPHVSAAIHDQPEDWTEIRGIQLVGEARRMTGNAAEAALASYLRRFPSLENDPRLARAFATAAVYELVPTRLFLIDNRRFGERAEVPLTGS